MRKRTFYGWAVGMICLAGMALNACDTFDLRPDPDKASGQPAIQLTFDTGMMTRADETDFSDGEKKMTTVDLFFYPTNGTGEAPVKTHHIDNTTHATTHSVSLSDSEFEALFGFSDKTQDGACVVYAVVNVPEDDITKSLAALEKTPATATAEDLKKIKTSTPAFAGTFTGGCLAMFSKDKAGDKITYKASDKTASGTVHLQNLAAKIDLLVNFGTNIQGVNPNDSDKGLQTWNVEKDKNGVPTSEVHILNGVKAVVMGVVLDGLDTNMAALEKEEDYYSIRLNDKNTRGVKALDSEDKDYNYNGKTWYATAAPYYSYPNTWADNPLEQYRTSLLLKVDWLPNDVPDPNDDDVLTTYYNVPLALDDNCLTSNKYYRVKVNINTLGGQNFGEPLEIENASVEVLDWQSAELEADIRELRYLEVSQKQKDRDGTSYTAVYNGNDCLITIPFQSSHKVEIRSVLVEYTSYEKYTSTTGDKGRDLYVSSPGTAHSITGISPKAFTQSEEQLNANDWHCAYIDNLNHTITVKHNVGVTAPDNAANPGHYYRDKGNKDINTYYSYLITIVLKHEDSDEFFEGLETITIMHHPSIYIEGEVNTAINETGWYETAVGGKKNEKWDREARGVFPFATWYHHGFVRVNTETRHGDELGGTRGIVKNENNSKSREDDNPVMYIINVTQLEEGSPYHIRDPRVTQDKMASDEGNEYGILSYKNSWAKAPHYKNGGFDNESAVLESYYPTDKSDIPEVAYAISPRFRVASGFGINPDELTRINAIRRCASYCEAGYPAGRWRLPTIGEIEYVTQLSKRGLIPQLFAGKDWVCAQDIYTFDDNGNGTRQSGFSNGYVRCVYDDWYWVRSDEGHEGEPDKIADPYTARSDHKIFIWGDKPKNNPQVQP